jgi:hypothetical protein
MIEQQSAAALAEADVCILWLEDYFRRTMMILWPYGHRRRKLMAFHLYDVTVEKETPIALRLLLTGAGIPHIVIGKPVYHQGLPATVLAIRPRAAKATDTGSRLSTKGGKPLFFDPNKGKASYDLVTLAANR